MTKKQKHLAAVKAPQGAIISRIKSILSGIDDSMEDDAKLSMVRGFWQAGQLAIQYKDATGMMLKDIAGLLDVPVWSLQRYTQFYKTFPKGYPKKYHNRVVTWTYMCCVLPVHDPKARDFYLQEACRHDWNKYQLVRRIKEGYFYGAKETGRAKTKAKLKAKNQRLYTYVSEVIKIVDGDTLDLEIDVGFKTKQEHRVRFRGINCPEIGTPQGKKAKKFVEGELNKCIVQKPLFKGRLAVRPMVVVKTYKLGIFGRYTVDIYYLPGEQDPEVIVERGKLLNQALLDRGFARKA